MSDSINYDELDKAVNAAINAKQAAKAQPKPAVAKAPQAAKKPASRGMFMDFAPVNARRVVVKKTIETHTIARVAANPATKATPTIPRPRVTPAPKLVARPVQARPAMARPVTKPAPIRAAAQAFPARPAQTPARPAAQTFPARPAQAPARTAAKPVTPKPTQARPALKVAEKPAPKITTAKPVLKAAEPAPNANNYSLGVRSPFLNTDAKVEKRPLGNNIPETSASALHSTRNVYSQKSALKNTEAAKKHIVTEGGKKKSGWLWALIVLAVIAAGGGLGYLAYLIVFAK